jgi:hypothetical protein
MEGNGAAINSKREKQALRQTSKSLWIQVLDVLSLWDLQYPARPE